MKKFYSIIAAVLCTLNIMAADYVANLGVALNGQVAAQLTQTIQAEKQANGKYTFALKNFTLGEVGVGNIEVTDIDATVDGNGNTTLSLEKNITISAGDKDGVDFWLGPMLGEVPIKLNGTLSANNVLEVRLDIPFGTETIAVFVSSAKFQIPNSDFELFHTETMGKNSSDEPNHWHSFMSCTGSMSSIVSGVKHTFIEESILRPGTKGKKSVKLTAGEVVVDLGIVKITKVANGTLTTGRLKAGSTDAASKDNCAFLDMSLTDKDGNGDPFYAELGATPDSLVVWVKYKQGQANAKYPYASVNAVITDGSYYQDPKGSDEYVAKASNGQIESNGFEWQRISCPFVYTGKNMDIKAILATITTNPEPAQAHKDDVIYVDDLELIYNSALSDIKIDGASLPGFNPNVLEYTVSSLDLAKLTYDAPADAKVVVFNSEEENKVYISSFAENLLSATTYTISYTTCTGISISEQAPAAATVVGIYNINGQRVPANAKGVIITKYSDGTSVKSVR